VTVKPRLPSEVRSGDLCDRHGVPICTGDLLKSFHFTHRHRRRRCYLYHAVTHKAFPDGTCALWLVPYAELLSGEKKGGCCYLWAVADADGVVRDAEVIDGPLGKCGADELGDFAERTRRKVKPPEGE
jgi:hypothetical protein